MTIGSVEPLRKLYREWKSEVTFLEVIVRQAHPGPDAPVYHTFDQKYRDAERYVREYDIPWPVLADGVDGPVHRMYGGLTDPSYIIDADGVVSFYKMWTHAPKLHRALERLMAQGCRGVVCGGIDRQIHFGSALANGWPGVQRGLPQSAIELELAWPLSGLSTWLGYQFKPLLAPLTLRSRPVPLAVKALGLGAAALGLVTIGSALRRHALR